ncbi:hypothetical protein DDD_3243 [Nonlabens dokdonensis DSW-6]|jgi:hypothetical protein|uniref:Uncharacterized protein n=2 Tax=Nonlabens dokdonensis TaxID=328515 RepID=L7W9K9_NONDD|nr:hypothetical protein DDD_3243 [Nonlabens dokdonensis DSW-6]
MLVLLLLSSCQKQITKSDVLDTEQSKYSIRTIDTLINSKDYLILGHENAKIKIINIQERENFPDFRIVDQKNSILIIAKNLNNSKLEIFEKWNPKYNFNYYKSSVFKGKLAEPDFNSNPAAKRFITRINEECKKGINFAGKYTLVIWGCGTSCQNGVIVNRINGEIYDGYSSTLGSKFKKDSKLILFNSKLINEETKLIKFHNMVDLRIETWNGSKFVKESN